MFQQPARSGKKKNMLQSLIETYDGNSVQASVFLFHSFHPEHKKKKIASSGVGGIKSLINRNVFPIL